MTPADRERLNQAWRELGVNPLGDEAQRIEAYATLAAVKDISEGFDKLRKEFEKVHRVANQTAFAFELEKAPLPVMAREKF